MANNRLKYTRIDPVLRAEKRLAWNKPVFWPLFVAGALFLVMLFPAIKGFRRRIHDYPVILKPNKTGDSRMTP